MTRSRVIALAVAVTLVAAIGVWAASRPTSCRMSDDGPRGAIVATPGYSIEAPARPPARSFSVTVHAPPNTAGEGLVLWQRRHSDEWRTIGFTRSMYGTAVGEPTFYCAGSRPALDMYSTTNGADPTVIRTTAPGPGRFRIYLNFPGAGAATTFAATEVRVR